MTTWSYSSLKTFEQCPKKYYHLKVAKDVKDEGSQATIYGNEVHKTAENYIKLGTPIPKQHAYMQPILDTLNSIPGEKHCELKLGLTENLTPTGFFSPDVWCRVIADLTIVNGDKGYLVDYKTSKNARYADTTQLDLQAVAVFTHFPELRTIKSALAFVVSNELIPKNHRAENRHSYFATFEEPLEKLAVAEQTGVWNAVSGPLCKFCPVTSCPHKRR